MAWRYATWPTNRSPVFVNATTDGTVRPPSADGMTVGSPPSMTATTEFVVPRSMSLILPMSFSGSCSFGVGRKSVGSSVDGFARLGVRRVPGVGGHGHEGGPDHTV